MRKRKIRRDFKIARIIALSLVALLSVFEVVYLLFGGLFSSDDVITLNNYRNSFSYNYKINTKPNEFVDYTNSKEYSAYVTKLIDNVELNFKYKFDDTSNKDSQIKYTYSIEGRLLGFYNKDSEEQKILQKENIILESKTNTVKGHGFSIDENVKIDLGPLNELVKNFKAQNDIQISSKYDVILKVEIEGVTKEKLTYSPKASIEIGGKTTKVVGDNNVVDNLTTSDANEYQVDVKNKTLSILFIAIFVYAIGRIIYLIFFTEEMLVIKNKYKGEINEIVRNYQDKIVMVNNLPELDNKPVITVYNMEEIAKLSEELYKPILCYEDEDETSTQFVIMSDDAVYKFLINK